MDVCDGKIMSEQADVMGRSLNHNSKTEPSHSVKTVSAEELRKLQLIELEMLIEFDRICRKYDIKYSLDGGTLLGAVRHKGFIPWDDDIDVIMLRSEYQRFKKAAKKELDTERFFLQDYTTDPEYRWGWAKLRRNGTSFIRSGQEHLKQHDGIFIDIMVADNVPDGFIERRIHHFGCYLVRKLMYSEVGKYQEKNPVIRFLYNMMSRVERDKIFRLRNNLIKRAGKERTELVSHYTHYYPANMRYGRWRDCFDEMIEVEFEGRKFPIFKEYDRYLKPGYGDYMKLPPEKDRIPHLTVSSLKMIDPIL